MSTEQTRRDVLLGAAATVAAAALFPCAAWRTRRLSLFGGLLKQQLPMAPDLDLGIRVSGCGAACDCEWYFRVECPFWKHVWKVGNKSFIVDMDRNVVGEARSRLCAAAGRSRGLRKSSTQEPTGCRIPITGPRSSMPSGTRRRVLKVLVCGGRDYADRQPLSDALSRLRVERGIAVLIAGGARGAERLPRSGRRPAVSNASCIMRIGQYRKGRRADPKSAMLDDGRPTLVVAFPGGGGTADMVRRARAAGIEVVEIDKD